MSSNAVVLTESRLLVIQGKASSAPQKAFAISDPFNCMRNNQPLRPGSEVSVLGYQSDACPIAKTFSAIPTAPHLRHCAPTSPRATDIIHPSSPKDNSTTNTRPSSPVADIIDQANLSRIRQAKEFAESHQLLAKKRLLGDEHGTGLPAPKVFSKLTSAAVHPEPAGLGHGDFSGSSGNTAAVSAGRPAHNASGLESDGRKSYDDPHQTSLREAPRSDDGSSVLDSNHLQDSRSKLRKKYALPHRGMSRTSTSSNEGTDEELLERITATGKFESNNVHNVINEILFPSSDRRLNPLTKPTISGCYSPRSSSFRETSTAALDTDIAPFSLPQHTYEEGGLVDYWLKDIKAVRIP